MKITNTRTSLVAFSRLVKGNESSSLCTIPFEVHTVEFAGFKADGFIAAEFQEGLTRDVVIVDGRYFQVSRSTGNMVDYWLSVTLPPGMDPRPQPREWKARVSKCPVTGKEYLWDNQIGRSAPQDETIRVREVLK